MTKDEIAAILTRFRKISVAGREPSVNGIPEAAQAVTLAQLQEVAALNRFRLSLRSSVDVPPAYDMARALSDLIGCFHIEDRIVTQRARQYVLRRSVEHAAAQLDGYMHDVFQRGYDEIRTISARMECMQ